MSTSKSGGVITLRMKTEEKATPYTHSGKDYRISKQICRSAGILVIRWVNLTDTWTFGNSIRM